MLKKVLKYDIRAISKLWWIGAVVSLAAAVVGSLLIRLFVHVVDEGTESILLTLASFLGFFVAVFCIFAVVLSFVFTVILVFVRFYRHFFTDEGYLTFTLPVKRSTLFLSKTVNAVIWLFAHLVVIAVSLILLALLFYSPEASGGFFNVAVLKGIGAWLVETWAGVGAWLIVYLFEGLLAILAYLLFFVSLIHFCITFGAVLAKKARLILSIGLYYAFSSALGVLAQFAFLFFGSLASNGMMILMENASINRACAVYALLALAVIAALAAIAVTFYAITQHMLDRKLNLA
ncbi:MAG: hypothetical protein E7606_05920 [Ruminococcaceae bacterium]|nr:hypothetical protein [Oscillospiraceae bacterium]